MWDIGEHVADYDSFKDHAKHYFYAYDYMRRDNDIAEQRAKLEKKA